MINLKTFTHNDIIDVENEENYNKICQLLDEAGFKWSTGIKYTDKKYSFNNIGQRTICPASGKHNHNPTGKRVWTLADILQSTQLLSNSSPFQTLFPFNL